MKNLHQPCPEGDKPGDGTVSHARAFLNGEAIQRYAVQACVLIIVGLISAIGVLSLVAVKPTEAAYENRKLAEKPALSFGSLISGQYVKDLELYYADTFPLREQFVRAAARIKECFGPRADGARIHSATDPADAEAAASPTVNLSEADEPAQTAPQEPALTPADTSSSDIEAAQSKEQAGQEGEKQGATFLINGKALSLFGGSSTASQRYAQALNTWKQTLGPQVTEYNLVIPTYIEFYPLPEKYKDISVPQKPNIDSIYAQLSPDIKAVDAYEKLSAHKEEYLYFGTDHHWTALGAYYAYTAFCEQAGLEPIRLEAHEKRTIQDFVGTLYTDTLYSDLLNYPDHVDYWMMPSVVDVTQFRRGEPFTPYPSMLYGEYAKSPNCYSVFLQGDYPLTKITTNVGSGRKIVMVKESFGNAFAPFLVNHYDEVYVVDQRYFQLNLPSFMQKNGIGEILFINNIFAANTTVRINELERLRTQIYVPPAPKPDPVPEEEQVSSESPESSQPPSDGKPRARKRLLSSSSSEESGGRD